MFNMLDKQSQAMSELSRQYQTDLEQFRTKNLEQKQKSAGIWEKLSRKKDEKMKENLTKNNDEIEKSVADAYLGFSKEENKEEAERDAATDLEVADLKSDISKLAGKSQATTQLSFKQKRQHRRRAGKWLMKLRNRRDHKMAEIYDEVERKSHGKLKFGADHSTVVGRGGSGARGVDGGSIGYVGGGGATGMAVGGGGKCRSISVQIGMVQPFEAPDNGELSIVEEEASFLIKAA